MFTAIFKILSLPVNSAVIVELDNNISQGSVPTRLRGSR